MIRNKNLTKAKKAKNDEFYTQYHDIQKEIQSYLDFNHDVFCGKTILLPCYDPVLEGKGIYKRIIIKRKTL